MTINRTTISVSLSKEALKLLDTECQRRGWQRPQVLDEIIFKTLKPEDKMSKTITLENWETKKDFSYNGFRCRSCSKIFAVHLPGDCHAGDFNCPYCGAFYRQAWVPAQSPDSI